MLSSRARNSLFLCARLLLVLLGRVANMPLVRNQPPWECPFGRGVTYIFFRLIFVRLRFCVARRHINRRALRPFTSLRLCQPPSRNGSPSNCLFMCSGRPVCACVTVRCEVLFCWDGRGPRPFSRSLHSGHLQRRPFTHPSAWRSADKIATKGLIIALWDGAHICGARLGGCRQ
jgi:hypothetical protein